MYTQQSSPRTKDHRASPQTIIHPSTLYQPGFSTPMRWKHMHYMEHHLPRELALCQVNSSSPCWDQDTSMKNPEHTACLTELICGSHRDITAAHHLRSAFEDSSTSLTSGHGSDTTCKDSGHHISPQWYDIVHFGPKPSWLCLWALPQKASYQWRYLSILIYP